MQLAILKMLLFGVIKMSKFNGVKTNNAKTTVKADLRNELLDKIKQPKVLEVFCGAGEMYHQVWHKAEKYTGIDKVKYFDKRHTICGDARKALRLIDDLAEFNIFDIDAYGSPYEVLDDILKLADIQKPVGFCITDGIDMDLRLGRVCTGIRKFIGFEHHIAKRANNLHDQFIKIVCEKVAEKLNGEITHFEIATGKTGAAMKYYAFVIE